MWKNRLHGWIVCINFVINLRWRTAFPFRILFRKLFPVPETVHCISVTKTRNVMKKDPNAHVNENVTIALWAGGFLAFVMLLSYLYWFA